MTKEERAEYNKIYRENNKEERAAKQKIYIQTESGKKSHRISEWKLTGLIHHDYDELYELYFESTHCDVCKCEYKDSFDKCMDHDHQTGLHRQFLCRPCNTNDTWVWFAITNLFTF